MAVCCSSFNSCGAFFFIALLKLLQGCYLELLFFFGGADHFGWDNRWRAFFVEEGIYTDDRVFAGMFQRFVVQAILPVSCRAGTWFP